MANSGDDTLVCTESAGDPTKPAIVFLHGLANCAAAWDGHFADPYLFQNFFLVRYDMRGHGMSGKPFEPEDYESIRFAEGFKAVCDGYGLKKPFFAGWSLGGSVVVDIVAAYGPSCIAGVLCIGGPVLSLTKYFPQCANPFLEITILSEPTDAIDVSIAANAFVDSCVAPNYPLSYSLKLKMLGAFVAQPRTVRVNHICRTQPSEFCEQHARDVPNMLRFVKEHYKDVEVKMLPGVGHSPALERVAETKLYIREWVTKVSAKQAM
ncbi:hypothetical protein BN946_scf184939.g50 [Trametes cinnabarina]|uniref:AB hydrolase-1 domain-containing protein n=1 Tax=Pycnoporus cinnabarinus TaxID=5643 RepID=A0A060SCB2_PYCCI|nr:hypothetical protein BN946_scf184939.g50 [Trametes cinnabarina]